jgi:transcriptional regulator with PAS, ATPase and Fis domain
MSAMATDPFQAIVGTSDAAEAMRSFGRRAARVDAPVLLLGESGTGKGVMARAIHAASRRASRPFVAINCAAVPDSLFESEFFGHVRGAFTGAQYTHKGLFEQAHTGTLFLDEIGELPLAAQAKLLTTLEDREVRRVGAERVATVDVRIIAATAADLLADVAARRFRADLFHRLSILLFELPPLRRRLDDVPDLAQHLLTCLAARYERDAPPLSDRALAQLKRHSWPGNVRELSNTLERALLLRQGASITLHTATLPAASRTGNQHVHAPASRYSFIGSSEEELEQIRSALTTCRGNKTRAAALLGMSRNTLLNKLRGVEL